MSWVITGAEKTRLDQDYRNVSLLLHGNADGSGNILDSSPSPKTVSKFGNAASATPPSYPNSNSSFGNAIAFDGSGGFLTVPDNADFEFGSGAFTIEAWIYVSGGSGFRTIAGKSNRNEAGGIGSFAVLVNPSNNLKCLASSDAGPSPANWQVDITSTTTLSTSTWHHIAFTRSGNTFALFLNGIQEAIATNSLTLVNNAQVLTIGTLGYTSGTFVNDFNGYIDDLRITKVARYTANFTPPTAPFPDAGPAQ